MKDVGKMIKREDGLLRNEKSWRRARTGVLILLLIWLLCSYALYKDGEFRQYKEALFASIGWVLFWMVLFDWLNLRIWHIESIKYYRGQKDEQKH